MPAASGVVTKVLVKEYDQPKSFVYEGKTITNTHRQAFAIGDDWYGMGDCNNGKHGEIYTKAGLITEGAEIEFMYDENESKGKVFRNVKKATVSIIKPGNAVSPVQQSKASAKGTDAYVIGMAVGAAMNQAAALHAKDKTLDFDALEKTAVQMYKIAENLKAQAESGDIESAVVDKSPASVDDSFDDDIPF